VIWREGDAQPRELGPWSTLWQVVEGTDAVKDERKERPW
jgi:hypothetical protein